MKAKLNKFKDIFISNNKNTIISIIVLLCVFASLTYFRYAAIAKNYIAAEVTFNNQNTGLTSNNVQDALEEIYARSNGATTFNKNYVLIQFETDGGTEIQSQYVAKNSAITKPTNPTKAGKGFKGWKDQNNNTFTNFAGGTSTNLVLTAEWGNLYTVNFYKVLSNNQTELYQTKSVVSGETISNFPGSPGIVSGQKFVGWGTTTACSTFFNSTDTVTKSMDLYACYTAETITITYDGNGGGWTQGEDFLAAKERTVAKGVKLSQSGNIPENPSKANSVFKYWTETETNQSSQTDALQNSYNANITLYAYYKNLYTVTFDSNSGSYVSSISVEDGNKFTKPTNPTRSGYKFKGWYSNSTLTTEYTFDNNGNSSSTVTSNLKLYAKWTKVHTVTFVTNGGSTVESQLVEDGNKVTEKTTTRKYYNFEGWYSNIYTSGNTYNFNNSVTSDLTLYAKWSYDQNCLLKIVYKFDESGIDNPDGLNFIKDNLQLDMTNENMKNLFATPSKTKNDHNYNFEGWALSSDEDEFVGNIYTADHPYDITSLYKNNSLTKKTLYLYAIYKSEPRTASFYGQGATSDNQENITKSCFSYNTSPTCLVSIPSYSYNSYSFDGWSSSANSFETVESMKNKTSMSIGSNVSYYAVFSTSIGKTFHANNNSFEGVTADTSTVSCTIYNIQSSCEITTPTIQGNQYTPTVIGYTTNPKFTYEEGAEILGSGIKITISTNGGDYYAQTSNVSPETNTWTAIYKTTDGIDKIGANSDSCIIPYVYNGELTTNTCSITLPSIELLEGYRNPVWNDGSNNYAAEKKYILRKNTDITATCALKSYNISFVTNGGSAVEEMKVDFKKKIKEPTKPERLGYYFLGWFKDESLETPWDFEKDVVMGHTTLYAKWELIFYVITFDTNGGSTVDKQALNYGQKVVKPEDPVKIGYNFKGWYTDPDFTKKYDFNTEVKSNVNLYAKWSKDDGSTLEIKSKNKSGGSIVVSKNDDVTSKIAIYEDNEVTGAELDSIKNNYFQIAEGIYVIDTKVKDKDGNELNVSSRYLTYKIPVPKGMSKYDNIMLYQMIDTSVTELFYTIEKNNIVFTAQGTGRYVVVKYAKNEILDSKNNENAINVNSRLAEIIKDFYVSEVVGTEKSTIVRKLFDSADNVFIFDTIILDSNGDEVETGNEKITFIVKLPDDFDEDNLKLYQIVDGEKIEVDFDVVNGKLMFISNSAGRFALAVNEDSEDEETETSGSKAPLFIGLGVVLLVGGSAGGFMYFKKKKNNTM